MRHTQLPRQVRQKLRSYYELCFPGKRSFEEHAILDDLSWPLQNEIANFKCQSVLHTLKLIDKNVSGVEPGMIAFLASLLKRVVFVGGDYIVRQGEF